MGCWSTTKEVLKSADLFSKSVELKMKPGKKGGIAKPKIGSLCGFCLSILVIITLISMGLFKSRDMFDYKKIKYSFVTVRNKFDEEDKMNGKVDSREIFIKNFTFLPSIEFFFMGTNEEMAQKI